MSLEEFKFIYWMEYAHRMWGRVLGLVFAGPALYFAARGWINSALARRLGILFLMGGTQGLVGWWMVRSGLQVTLSPVAVMYRTASWNCPARKGIRNTQAMDQTTLSF